MGVAKKKILAIDDDATFCEVLKKSIATRYGHVYQVLTAYDGRTGLEMARTEKPDIILLDIIMPGVSGSEIAEHLAESPATKDIPIIFVTAIISGREAGSGESVRGNRVFFAKPVDVDRLMEKVKEMTSA